MSDNNKNLMRQDLKYILQLNAKTDYNNLAEVKKTYDMILQKNLFHSPLGQRYTKRLKQIIDKTDDSQQCVLCKNNMDNLTLVCTQCLEKYKLVRTDNKNTLSQTQNSKDIGQQISEKSKQTVSTIKGGLDILSTKISETAAENGIDLTNMPKMENLKDIKKEDVVNVANKSKDTAKKGVKKSVSFWNSLSGKRKIAVVAVVVVLLIFAFGRNTSHKVSDPASAQKVIEKVFSKSKYTITYQKEVMVASGIFKMKVGKTSSEIIEQAENNGETDKITAYIFHICNIHDEADDALCWVSEDGRIVGTGDLVSTNSEDLEFVRLK